MGDINVKVETMHFNDTEKWKKDLNKTVNLYSNKKG